MCLIIRTKTSFAISKHLLANMQKRNDDGFGFMWIQDNKLKTYKNSGSDFETLWNKYEELKQYEPLIHLRYKTHGAIDFTNTHPYNCGHGIYLMHNGVIRVDDSDDRTKSDTWHFIDQLIRPLIDLVPNPHELIRSKKFKKIMEMQLGSSNRMVMGDRGGFVAFGENNWHKITNEKTGVAGMWVSNTYAWDAHSYDPNPKPAVIVSPAGWRSQYSQPIDYPMSNPQSKYYTDTHRLKNDKIVYWCGQEYNQIVGNIYETEDGEIYMNNGLAMKRRKDLDKEYNDATNRIYCMATRTVTTVPEVTQLPLALPAPAGFQEPTNLGIISNGPSTAAINEADRKLVEEDHNDESAEMIVALSQEDYDRELTRGWMQRKPYEISTMVYTEADEAARVLNYLITHGALSV